MNRDLYEGTFKQLSGRLKEYWGTLTNDPGTVKAGRRDQLAGRIEAQHGSSKRESDRQLDEFRRRNRNWRELPER